MKPSVRSGMVRHPLFADIATVPASQAVGSSAAIAGTFAELLQAAAAGARATRALFPLQASMEAGLSEFERDTLWELFEVPVYAVVLDADGRVLAFECEAQEGLHLDEGVPAPDVIETTLCECGLPGPRLIPARPELIYAPRRRAG